MSIHVQLQTPPEERDLPWLLTSLQYAIELEHSTIPPYLCAWWSVKDPNDLVGGMISDIVNEEMAHMALACNMLTTLGGTPAINTPDFIPKYPGPLPHGVRPSLTKVALVGLSRDVVHDTFMEIEYPEGGQLVAPPDETYATIGDFYDAILAAFQALPPASITGQHQVDDQIYDLGFFTINNLTDVEKAIQQIKGQGEGTTLGPYEEGESGDFAHYYKFAEIYYGKKLIHNDQKQWVFEGDVIQFPDCLPMAEVPLGGYDGDDFDNFDKTYTSLLAQLHALWQNGSDNIQGVVEAMRPLTDQGTALMQRPRPATLGAGNYGPCFRYKA